MQLEIDRFYYDQKNHNSKELGTFNLALHHLARGTNHHLHSITFLHYFREKRAALNFWASEIRTRSEVATNQRDRRDRRDRR
jgi:hypothetical protein